MTPPDDVSERLETIRDRYESVPWNASGSDLRERTLAEEDVPYLLSLVERMRHRLLRIKSFAHGPRTGITDEEALETIEEWADAALRDAALEGAE